MSTVTYDIINERPNLLNKFSSYIKEDVEDAFSSAFTIIFLLAENKLPTINIKGFMFTIMKNILNNQIRKRKKEKSIGTLYFSDLRNNFYNEDRDDKIDSKNKLDMMDIEVLMQLFKILLPKLSPRQQEVLVLYLKRYNDKQIAKMLSCSAATVRATKKNAIRAFQQVVKGCNPDEILNNNK